MFLTSSGSKSPSPSSSSAPARYSAIMRARSSSEAIDTVYYCSVGPAVCKLRSSFFLFAASFDRAVYVGISTKYFLWRRTADDRRQIDRSTDHRPATSRSIAIDSRRQGQDHLRPALSTKLRAPSISLSRRPGKSSASKQNAWTSSPHTPPW